MSWNLLWPAGWLPSLISRPGAPSANGRLPGDVHLYYTGDACTASLCYIVDRRWRFFSAVSQLVRGYHEIVLARLLHKLRKRCHSTWIVNFISSFLSERSTFPCLLGFSSTLFLKFSSIPQGFPLLPIHFLFYDAELADLCNSPDLPTSPYGFIDDVNIWAFGKSTEETYTTQNEIHRCCMRRDAWSLFYPRKTCFSALSQ